MPVKYLIFLFLVLISLPAKSKIGDHIIHAYMLIEKDQDPTNINLFHNDVRPEKIILNRVLTSIYEYNLVDVTFKNLGGTLSDQEAMERILSYTNHTIRMIRFDRISEIVIGFGLYNHDLTIAPLREDAIVNEARRLVPPTCSRLF